MTYFSLKDKKKLSTLSSSGNSSSAPAQMMASSSGQDDVAREKSSRSSSTEPDHSSKKMKTLHGNQSVTLQLQTNATTASSPHPPTTTELGQSQSYHNTSNVFAVYDLNLIASVTDQSPLGNCNSHSEDVEAVRSNNNSADEQRLWGECSSTSSSGYIVSTNGDFYQPPPSGSENEGPPSNPAFESCPNQWSQEPRQSVGTQGNPAISSDRISNFSEQDIASFDSIPFSMVGQNPARQSPIYPHFSAHPMSVLLSQGPPTAGASETHFETLTHLPSSDRDADRLLRSLMAGELAPDELNVRVQSLESEKQSIQNALHLYYQQQQQPDTYPNRRTHVQVQHHSTEEEAHKLDTSERAQPFDPIQRSHHTIADTPPYTARAPGALGWERNPPSHPRRNIFAFFMLAVVVVVVSIVAVPVTAWFQRQGTIQGALFSTPALRAVRLPPPPPAPATLPNDFVLAVDEHVASLVDTLADQRKPAVIFLLASQSTPHDVKGYAMHLAGSVEGKAEGCFIDGSLVSRLSPEAQMAYVRDKIGIFLQLSCPGVVVHSLSSLSPHGYLGEFLHMFDGRYSSDSAKMISTANTKFIITLEIPESILECAPHERVSAEGVGVGVGDMVQWTGRKVHEVLHGPGQRMVRNYITQHASDHQHEDIANAFARRITIVLPLSCI